MTDDELYDEDEGEVEQDEIEDCVDIESRSSLREAEYCVIEVAESEK